MNIPSEQDSRLKKLLLPALTIVLWLATVLLGFWAVAIIQNTVDVRILAYIFQEVESQEMGASRGGGLRSVVNYATIAIAVLIWLGAVVIGGMEYHFKRVGQRNSYRIFAWTIGIELAIIIVGTLLTSV